MAEEKVVVRAEFKEVKSKGVGRCGFGKDCSEYIKSGIKACAYCDYEVIADWQKSIKR